jgi:hypothetical protein
MAGDTIAVSQGSQALAGHNPAAANETKRIFADEQGALRIDGGFKSVAFTWNPDSTASVIDVVKIVNGVDVTKRLSFTWAAGKLQSLVSSIV